MELSKYTMIPSIPLESFLWLHRGDFIVALFMIVLLVYSQTLLSVEQPEGYHQLFLIPQEIDGLVRPKASKTKALVTRNICMKLAELRKDGAILWGSQSGRSERLAKSLAHECQTRYGISILADDLDNYDHEHLASLEKGKIVGFIVATFGEGDPTDNAIGLDQFLSSMRECYRNNPHSIQLPQLRYFAFGLGNSKYQHYNRFVDVLDTTLQQAGATRLGLVGKLDEAMQADLSWSLWKEEVMVEMARQLNVVEVKSAKPSIAADLKIVNQIHTKQLVIADHIGEKQFKKYKGHSEVFAASMLHSRILSKRVSSNQDASNAQTAKTYLHAEFSLSGTKTPVTYQSGDHVAIWPMNPDREVQRFATSFGWTKNDLSTVIEIQPKESAFGDLVDHITSPSTRDTLLRYHLDICGCISIENVQIMTDLAPTPKAKQYLQNLTRSGNWPVTTSNFYTYGELMEASIAEEKAVWSAEVFALFVQNLPKLQPRYFSIASSPRVNSTRLAITAGILTTQTSRNSTFHGLATNYLYALHEEKQGGKARCCGSDTEEPSFAFQGPRGSLKDYKVLMHIRPSSFKLPTDTSRPLLMVAAGSGIAPLRAFIQERARQRSDGAVTGRILLFFGCRSPAKDFLYEDEWKEYPSQGFLDVDCAFSSFEGQSVYVQHRLMHRGEEVKKLLTEEEAHWYICGNVSMATDVKDAVVNTLVASGWDSHKAVSFLKGLQQSRRLQEDVWA